MRFSIEIPDELLRGMSSSPVSQDRAATGVAAASADALSGGAAQTNPAAGLALGFASDALSAGAAEAGGELAFDTDPFSQTLNGGAAPR